MLSHLRIRFMLPYLLLAQEDIFGAAIRRNRGKAERRVAYPTEHMKQLLLTITQCKDSATSEPANRM
jgi:hypothetical protein